MADLVVLFILIISVVISGQQGLKHTTISSLKKGVWSSGLSLYILPLFSPPPWHSVLMLAYLAGADRAPIVLQDPNLPIVFDLAFIDTVSCAVLPMWTPTVIATIQVKTNGVIGTAVPPCGAFINVCRKRSQDDSTLHSMNPSHYCHANLQLTEIHLSLLVQATHAHGTTEVQI